VKKGTLDFMSVKEERVASNCIFYGYRPDENKKPECNDCKVVKWCSALTIRNLFPEKKITIIG